MKNGYEFIGWCRDPIKNTDKVWGVIDLNTTPGGDGDYAVFWGRRGGKLQTKIYKDANNWDIGNLIQQKQDKGYEKIDRTRLNNVYPEFEQDLEKTTVWVMLKA